MSVMSALSSSATCVTSTLSVCLVRHVRQVRHARHIRFTRHVRLVCLVRLCQPEEPPSRDHPEGVGRHDPHHAHPPGAGGVRCLRDTRERTSPFHATEVQVRPDSAQHRLHSMMRSSPVTPSLLRDGTAVSPKHGYGSRVRLEGYLPGIPGYLFDSIPY